MMYYKFVSYIVVSPGWICLYEQCFIYITDDHIDATSMAETLGKIV